MSRTVAVSILMLIGVWLAQDRPAHGQILDGEVPSETYAPLHAWYDVNQSLDVWEGRNDQYDDEFLVDVRDTGTGSGAHRGESYGTNVETWAQFDDPPNDGSSWPARVGGFTGTQNGMTTWEVRNAAGWDDGGGWTDEDGIGTDGIGASAGYTFFMVMNIHSTERYNGAWNVDPGDPLEDVPILNGLTSAFNEEPTTGSEPGKAFLWIDANRDGFDGPQWIIDAGKELVAGPVTLNEWQVHSFVVADDSNNSLTSYYVNGELVGEGDADIFGIENLQLWSTDGGWHRAADLDFAEALFYDEVVSVADRVGIEQYLFDKWVSAPNVDIDNDGDVDGNDFLGIQRTDPSLIPEWESKFGSVSDGISAVPEPTSAMLLLGLVSVGLLGYRSRHRDA